MIRTAILGLAAATACGGTRAPPTPSNHATPSHHARQSDLCELLATMVSAGSINFAEIGPARNDAAADAWAEARKPVGATQAMFVPCCASASAESGPWTWVAVYRADPRGFARLRDEVMACSFAPRLTGTTQGESWVKWEYASAHVTIGLSATSDKIDLSVEYD